MIGRKRIKIGAKLRVPVSGKYERMIIIDMKDGRVTVKRDRGDNKGTLGRWWVPFGWVADKCEAA